MFEDPYKMRYRRDDTANIEDNMQAIDSNELSQKMRVSVRMREDCFSGYCSLPSREWCAAIEAYMLHLCFELLMLKSTIQRFCVFNGISFSFPLFPS